MSIANAKRLRAAVAFALLGAMVLVGVTVAAEQDGTQPIAYKTPGGTEVGVRPTGVGLPSIGESGTVGAGELANTLREYHDSGDYEADLSSVDGAAQSYLDAHASTGKAKPALVLDIDETSLSNYAGLLASGFTAAGLVPTAASGTAAAIAPTLALYRDAVSRGVAVFFITGRPSELQSITETNLRNVGYDEGWSGIYFKPTEADTEAFKSSTRKEIDKDHYRIVLDVGDQQSDLDGGYAQRDFKLPDPFYFIPD